MPEPITHEDDVRLPQWGIGMTNLIARPSPGIDVLKPQEYVDGWKILERKIDRFRPRIVAFVGVTMYRALARTLGQTTSLPIAPGLQRATVHGARIFVLPNPSGRNAHFSYDEMLAAFTDLARAAKRRAKAGAGESEGPGPSDDVSARRSRGRRAAGA